MNKVPDREVRVFDRDFQRERLCVESATMTMGVELMLNDMRRIELIVERAFWSGEWKVIV